MGGRCQDAAVIPHTLLVAATPFGGALSAERVSAEIARGLGGGGSAYDIEECPLEAAGAIGQRPQGLGPELTRRVRAARALILAGPDLCGEPPPPATLFELATEARQHGVPAYAVSAVADPDLFQARILDLQAVLRATEAGALVRAGHALCELLQPGS